MSNKYGLNNKSVVVVNKVGDNESVIGFDRLEDYFDYLMFTNSPKELTKAEKEEIEQEQFNQHFDETLNKKH